MVRSKSSAMDSPQNLPSPVYREQVPQAVKRLGSGWAEEMDGADMSSTEEGEWMETVRSKKDDEAEDDQGGIVKERCRPSFFCLDAAEELPDRLWTPPQRWRRCPATCEPPMGSRISAAHFPHRRCLTPLNRGEEADDAVTRPNDLKFLGESGSLGEKREEEDESGLR
ncbi:hypothetical protein HPP92_006077 [Vanilla planifolia]|uniref:Uncharacterized protein n=1 Tax=Vanilla planifolia TaxID=51239 RepID=A0A835VFB6_VANPL|nr:hypothetical protein HPP92_006077 [Vanilla planifolia]